ncbi:uncharacterized protein SCHCODRAFT_02486342 [Schizophyllum commune H4-8]|uniref:Uncharacterized protein n=1 Tax=Schizophyllum commune (strain H4-8 / FGSC 9210) TaxID=578458 RepID=D8PSG1_SCHCM|nr:uncharacterized protein SCHCODRAFT_02486342 [Schizophyllum commune H4-8]KAI5897779.1 hypothetical protein SCHCODRAFT_02486342 [Schizophyllum commune H4-8]
MTATMSSEQALVSATRGFDALFSNELAEARDIFSSEPSAFHQLGFGVCAFLEAALGMEQARMGDAGRSLAAAESGAKKQKGLEWEVLAADAVVLEGLVHALSESYMGYVQCLYSLNSAHSRFAKLFTTVFPNGLDAAPNTIARKPSSVFRWGAQKEEAPAPHTPAVDEMIVAGTAFGYGLFNLVFSLLPKGVQGVVGLFGYKHDRALALRALNYASGRTDTHAVFAGLVLMTYHGVVLLLAGWQADEARLVREYQAIVDRTTQKYPAGALWILNHAKIQRMTGQPDAAIATLEAGLAPGHKHTFQQADALLVFELAWTQLALRRYEDAAASFIRMTELNSWSHATYYFIAAGAHLAAAHEQGVTTAMDRAQELLDAIPGLIEQRKLTGKDLPTEVFIKKKLDFYRNKQRARGGDPARYAEAVGINLAEEMALFWNTHQRIPASVARTHLRIWAALEPKVDLGIDLAETGTSGTTTPVETAFKPAPLTTEDERAVRSLLLGIVLRTLAMHAAKGAEDAEKATSTAILARSRHFLREARGAHVQLNTWIPSVSAFEEAVLELETVEIAEKEGKEASWQPALHAASAHLDAALAASGSSVDLSSRLDSRVAMLRDEIRVKEESLRK